MKYFPGPFETFEVDTSSPAKNLYFPCIEVTLNKAVHLQKVDGSVVLLEQPGFYMPEVGEKVIKVVKRIVLLQTDFCMIKSPDGEVFVLTGDKPNPADRAFFLAPFHEFVVFHCDVDKTILSTLVEFIPHTFTIRTSDNVVLQLDINISYQIKDVKIFAANPIDFYPFIKNYVQNEMLHCFSANNLREFMQNFASIASATSGSCGTHLTSHFGINILDVQILNYRCTEAATQKLLDLDIHTNVRKQNELKARQQDIQITKQANAVAMKQKELEVEMAKKDNELALQKKLMENEIRVREMNIEILEEDQRTSLLDVKRHNDLVVAEYSGKSEGGELREFMHSLDPDLNTNQKLEVWLRMMDLEQARMLYKKVDSISMYPPTSDLKMFNFGTESTK